MTTTTTERVSVTAILADLILLQSRAGLPMPTDMEATGGNSILYIRVSTAAGVAAWARVLDFEKNLAERTFSDGVNQHDTTGYRSGWFVRVLANVTGEVAESLPAETLAELEQIAAVASCEWTGGAGCAKPAGPDDHLCIGHRETVQSALRGAQAWDKAMS